VIVDALRHFVQIGKRTLPTILSVKDVADQAEAAKDGMQTAFTAKHTGALLRGLGFHPQKTRRGFEFELTEGKLEELNERYPPAP